MAMLMFTRFINLRNVININNFGAIGSILNITQCSDVISKPYCININDDMIPHKSAKLTGKKISSAMRAYLKQSNDYKEFMKKQIAEYDIGKRYLANIMGEDPENFTQKDINSAIRYLFPSGLYDQGAQPMMLHPIDVYGNRKEAEFDESGRPHHFLFYTTKPNYYEILHNIAKSMIHLNKIEDQILERNIQSAPEHKIDLSDSEWLQKKSLEKILLEELLDKEYDYFIKSMQRLVDHPVSKHAESFIMEYRRKLLSINQDMKIPQLEYDSDNRPFVLIDRCARKNTRGEVKVIGNGSGKITINGKDLTYFDDMQCREQIDDVIA
ncbi:28S ribosomal protein S9, mitochondrial-like isoform X3 [Bombus vosnesenskii]|uniref:28S ribosomal protein S9, mitochondrial-like isoform X3 n=1 Tax=Bombus vosnesenskii TaxID=207650 RepID=A0A6J3K0F4_9HYME|nr:28S ribosomal protein S9, mitochondrial-like isoform X3 [Bombus vosnesenskii]